MSLLTLIDLRVCDCLPLVHCDEPPIVFPPTTKVYDELFLVISEGGENKVQTLLEKLAFWEEVGGYDHLPCSVGK